MSEFIRLRANGADAYPDASTENTYRPNGTSVESALVNLESNVTTLGGVAGEAKTLAEQNSVKIATAEQEISDINSSLTLDYSHASSDVQNVNTLLQNLLDRFYPSNDGYLFKQGDKCTNITGGWSGDGWSISGGNYSLTSGTFSGINMCLDGVGTSQGQLLATVNKIDLTNYNSLKFNVSEITTDGSMGGIVFLSATKVAPGAENQIIISKEGLNEVNLSTYNGEYYIGFSAFNRSDRTMKIDNVWVE